MLTATRDNSVSKIPYSITQVVRKVKPKAASIGQSPSNSVWGFRRKLFLQRAVRNWNSSPVGMVEVNAADPRR